MDEMPEPPRNRFWAICVIIGGLIILAVLLLNHSSRMILGVLIGSHEIRVTERKMQRPAVYEPVARTLALYCQSEQKLFPQILSYAWIPPEVSRLGQPWCQVSSNYAFVEMGGGFYHFGYRMTLDQAASSPATNVWDLFLAREGSPDLHLTTLRLAEPPSIWRLTIWRSSYAPPLISQ